MSGAAGARGVSRPGARCRRHRGGVVFLLVAGRRRHADQIGVLQGDGARSEREPCRAVGGLGGGEVVAHALESEPDGNPRVVVAALRSHRFTGCGPCSEPGLTSANFAEGNGQHLRVGRRGFAHHQAHLVHVAGPVDQPGGDREIASDAFVNVMAVVRPASDPGAGRGDDEGGVRGEEGALDPVLLRTATL